jgi:uncharacterized membrane protein YsdA (DUF1294 family)
MRMSLPLALGLAAVALVMTILFGWLGARPAQPLGPPRLIPWRFMMMLSFALVVAALVHAMSLVRGQ